MVTQPLRAGQGCDWCGDFRVAAQEATQKRTRVPARGRFLGRAGSVLIKKAEIVRAHHRRRKWFNKT
jgi:hypothetical protein